MCFVRADAQQTTRARLLAAASALFAERGFRATTIREIAAHANVNVAAGNYHYGSKKALYLEVLRAQFAQIRRELDARGARRSARALARLSRAALRDLLRARLNVMLELLLGPPPGVHGTLMQREMCDPSEALPVIVDEFVAPMMREMREIAAQLAPGLDERALERCVFSITGQAVFYRFAMPAMLRLLDLPAYPTGFTRQLGTHITDFSLGGMERLARVREPRRSRRAS
jgi:TetR/AcrR family transcriptional regulator, regulator of cefoperazone and chloramphenicol sensitivity